MEKRGKRPVFLTVLCILSFVWLGIGLLSSAASISTGPTTEQEIQKAKDDADKEIEKLKEQNMESWIPAMEKVGRMTVEMNRNFYLVLFVNLFVTLFGIGAVISMFRGLKLGFHLYIMYCLVSIGSTYIYVSPQNVPTFFVIVNFCISTLFIFMYSRNLKWMR